jgi:4-aminobutyrate aminotransferase-like enzyme
MIIMPPLVISDEEIAFVLDALEKSFVELEKI